jgi:hypothetical protein
VSLFVHSAVIPAKAGIQADSPPAPRVSNTRWIPAFAGMTGVAVTTEGVR